MQILEYFSYSTSYILKKYKLLTAKKSFSRGEHNHHLKSELRNISLTHLWSTGNISNFYTFSSI